MLDKNSKGFFFVLITFLILGYILTSVSLWTKSIDISEKKFADKFKYSNLESVANQVSEDRIKKFFELSLYKALYTINEESVEHPLTKGPSDQESKYFETAIQGLINDGKIDSSVFDGNAYSYQYPASEDMSLKAWISSLENTINPLGLEISDYKLSSFNLIQSSYKSFDYSVNFHLNINDASNSAFITRDLILKGSISIEGLADPAFLRYTKSKVDSENGIRKQFFFNDQYIDEASVQPSSLLHASILESGTEGQGWFYGNALTVDQAKNTNPFYYSSSILVGSFDDMISLENYESFGAYIITSAVKNEFICGSDHPPKQSGTFNALQPSSCSEKSTDVKNPTDKPFIVVTGFKIPQPLLYYPEQQEETRVLIYSDKDPIKSSPELKLNSKAKIYDIEKTRDFAICGYYALNSEAPSYIQRLFKNSYTLSDKKYGIESFALGKWVGGEGAKIPDSSSRLDREMVLENVVAKKIEGLPGCKSKDMCSGDSSPIGHFAISEKTAVLYLGDNTLVCKDNKCG